MTSTQGDGDRRARAYDAVAVSPAAGLVVGEVLGAGAAQVIVPDYSLAAAAARAAARKAAPATRKTYAGVYAQLVAFAGPGAAAGVLDDELVIRYRNHLEGRGLSPATVAKHLSAVRELVRAVGGPGAAAALGVRGARVAAGEPRPLEPVQADRLLAMADLRTTRGQRDRAMLLLMLDAGVRREELIALDVTSIEETRRHATAVRGAITGSTSYSVRVSYGKGGKQRVVPLTARTVDAVRSWMAVRPQSASLALFLSVPRRPDQRPERLSKVAVWRMVTAYAERAGLPDDTAPHTLRHTFASSLAAAGIPLEVGQKLLGHADPRTTLVYWKQHDRAGADAIATLEHSRLTASRL